MGIMAQWRPFKETPKLDARRGFGSTSTCTVRSRAHQAALPSDRSRRGLEAGSAAIRYSATTPSVGIRL
jgi:hypothetical protein